MRITITLDPVVNAKLRAGVRRSGKPFKYVVNDRLRVGINAQSQASASKPFVVKARPLGLRPGLNYDNIEKLLDKIEGPLRK
ncbi:MAG TPA: DUF2191 domain-containing protein [Terriglobia bacterium]|nr:DUF2191 domain-containing protein [Terriglobia bacterium]